MSVLLSLHSDDGLESGRYYALGPAHSTVPTLRLLRRRNGLKHPHWPLKGVIAEARL